ncbi:MAG TPA: hypothetical protein VLL54_13400 [Pyrinomonadaceae bacterium]|nr:hypothetical protein [Pyrinomonadaceae bacterium]
MKTPSTRLVHLLIGKSIAETIVVGALAVFAFVSLAPPTFHGWGELSEMRDISGWAVNNASPWERVEVQLFVDGHFAGTAIANQSRPDVSAAGWAKDPWHGYTFAVNTLPSGLHEARVYALHTSGRGLRKSLQLLGDPIHFVVGNDGKVYSGDSRSNVSGLV